MGFMYLQKGNAVTNICFWIHEDGINKVVSKELSWGLSDVKLPEFAINTALSSLKRGSGAYFSS